MGGGEEGVGNFGNLFNDDSSKILRYSRVTFLEILLLYFKHIFVMTH